MNGGHNLFDQQLLWTRRSVISTHLQSFMSAASSRLNGTKNTYKYKGKGNWKTKEKQSWKREGPLPRSRAPGGGLRLLAGKIWYFVRDYNLILENYVNILGPNLCFLMSSDQHSNPSWENTNLYFSTVGFQRKLNQSKQTTFNNQALEGLGTFPKLIHVPKKLLVDWVLQQLSHFVSRSSPFSFHVSRCPVLYSWSLLFIPCPICVGSLF